MYIIFVVNYVKKLCADLFFECKQLLCMKQQSWSLLVIVLTYIKYFVRNKKKKKYSNFNYKIQIKKERFIYNKGTILYNIRT